MCCQGGKGRSYDKAGRLYFTSEIGVFGQETISRVNHLRAMLNGDLDNLVAGEVGSDRSVLSALADDICLVGLCGGRLASSESYGNSKSRILCLCIERRSS